MRSASILVLLWLWSSTALAGPTTLYVFGDTPGAPRGDATNPGSQNGDCGAGTRVSSGEAGTEHDPFISPCLPGGGGVFITNDLSLFGDDCGAGTRVSTGGAGAEDDPFFNTCLPGSGCGAGTRVSTSSTGTESDPFFNPCLPDDEPFSARLLSSLVDENNECIFCSLEPELVTFVLRIDVAEPVATVPVPASLAMFGVGLAGLGICRHRRSNFRRS